VDLGQFDEQLLGEQLAAPGERPALGADAVLGVERAQRACGK
jgi:hypothetical protein